MSQAGRASGFVSLNPSLAHYIKQAKHLDPGPDRVLKPKAITQHKAGLSQEEPYSPPVGMIIFDVDGAMRGKLGPACIRGVFQNNKGDILCMFSNSVGVKDSNEA